ncbi:hypothetical protein [Luteimonas sp. SDU101]|uniref:hypothetical protein n=1 Tax=Luteimonas sp. SDU101 TaxID=3422593 RepID=UPI003EB93428
MTDSSFQMSQGYQVLAPKSGKAYPIPCEEWKLLKEKISRISDEPWLFHTLGSALIGMAFSAALPIVSQAFQLPEQQRSLDVTWMVLICTGLLGIGCLLLAQKQRRIARERASDVSAQMQVIEQRYESAP